MSEIKIIGLCGFAGSGKDWISQNILAPLGYKQYSLAWPFKADLISKGVLTYSECFDNPKPQKVRDLLQFVGTELGRVVYGEDIWLYQMEAWTKILYNYWGINKFVIADVRFFNERDFIQGMGGKVIFISAPGREKNSGLTEGQRSHPSEWEMHEMVSREKRMFDAIIHNDEDDDPKTELTRLLSEWDYD